VADDHNIFRAIEVVRSHERSADHSLDAQHLEEGPGDLCLVYIGRHAGVHDRDTRDRMLADARDPLEQPALIRDDFDIVVPERIMCIARRAQLLPCDDDPIVAIDRKRAQQDAVTDGGHRCRARHADHENQPRHHREGGCPA
jgi:hypothetical protein